MAESNWNFEGGTKSSDGGAQMKYQISPKNKIFFGVKVYILFCIIHLLTNRTHAVISLMVTIAILMLKTKYNQSLLARIIDTVGWLINGMLNVASIILLIACFIYITDRTRIFNLVLFTQ